MYASLPFILYLFHFIVKIIPFLFRTEKEILNKNYDLKIKYLKRLYSFLICRSFTISFLSSVLFLSL